MLLKSAECIKRYEGNPVLSHEDIPYNASLIFNAGVTKYQGKYIMVFRNDYEDIKGSRNLTGTNMGIAFSDDGINFTVSNTPIAFSEKVKDADTKRIYDPRLTVIDDELYICFAMDTAHGVRGGIAKTSDLENFEVLSLSVPDNRNMVLFPEKIGNEYIRLERPFPVYSRGRDRFDIWMSSSPDMRYWGNSKLILGVEDVPFANDKVGPAAPPVKTSKGWLTTFHAVDIDATRGKNGWEDSWKKRYTAGLMLLDLNDPSKVLGIYEEPLIAPEAIYEIDGFRNNVIFPGGMILEDDDTVKIYYGAADTVECLATANVDDLLALMRYK